MVACLYLDVSRRARLTRSIPKDVLKQSRVSSLCCWRMLNAGSQSLRGTFSDLPPNDRRQSGRHWFLLSCFCSAREAVRVPENPRPQAENVNEGRSAGSISILRTSTDLSKHGRDLEHDKEAECECNDAAFVDSRSSVEILLHDLEVWGMFGVATVNLTDGFCSLSRLCSRGFTPPTSGNFAGQGSSKWLT